MYTKDVGGNVLDVGAFEGVGIFPNSLPGSVSLGSTFVDDVTFMSISFTPLNPLPSEFNVSIFY